MQALVIVDVQNDFVTDGALAIPHGEQVVPVINRLIPEFELVVASKDWHPANHGSFASQHPGKKPGDIIDLNGLSQLLWPDHCVQGTLGAEFVDSLETHRIKKVFYKGTDIGVDSYSSFFDNGKRNSTGLGEYLKEQNVKRVTLVGLATDYCVKFSAFDAKELGFDVTVLRAGVRGVELEPGDCERAFEEMTAAGINVIKSL